MPSLLADLRRQLDAVRKVHEGVRYVVVLNASEFPDYELPADLAEEGHELRLSRYAPAGKAIVFRRDLLDDLVERAVADVERETLARSGPGVPYPDLPLDPQVRRIIPDVS